MASASYSASVPGKLMLMGEHAVLHGHPCLVAAVNRRLTVTLTPRADELLRVRSAMGEYQGDIRNLTLAAPFEFVLGAIQAQGQLPTGFDLTIESAFSNTVGLGSSAAVTAATTAALHAWLGQSTEPRKLFDQALTVIRNVQGSGSGADLAASVYGGVLRYRAEPLAIEPLAKQIPLTVVNSGHKTPTTEVIAQVAARRERFPEIVDAIYRAMAESVKIAESAILHADWQRLGEVMTANHGLMAALGVSSPTLNEIAQALQTTPGITGAKISGAGLGDCVIGIGNGVPTTDHAVLDLRIDPVGIRIE